MRSVDSKTAALKDLQTIPGIGKSLSEDLWDLGISKVADLKGKNPAKLYNKLNKITGSQQDPCVLYTFRCAVYFASEKRLDANKLKWWYWKDRSYNE
jgi:hypothetical protein